MGKKHPCGECDYQATTKSHLTAHQRSVHMGQKHPCEECGYQAKTKGNLTRHKESVHTDVRNIYQTSAVSKHGYATFV